MYWDSWRNHLATSKKLYNPSVLITRFHCCMKFDGKQSISSKTEQSCELGPSVCFELRRRCPYVENWNKTVWAVGWIARGCLSDACIYGVKARFVKRTWSLLLNCAGQTARPAKLQSAVQWGRNERWEEVTSLWLLYHLVITESGVDIDTFLHFRLFLCRLSYFFCFSPFIFLLFESFFVHLLS